MNKNIPKYSILGFIFVIITLLVKLSFTMATDIGMKIVLSSFSSMLLIFTPFWMVMGIREFRTIMKQIKKLEISTEASLLEKRSVDKKYKNLKVSLWINIFYLATVVVQITYIISNWDQINI